MKRTILFVDDEEINLFVLSRRFEEDFNVLTSNSALEAMEIIKSQKGQLHALISDVKMPEMTGIQLIDELKDYLEGVPCFLLTGYDHHEAVEEALATKKVELLFRKPFDYNEMNKVLKSYLY
ncbi:MAG: response regulator [Bacteroidota bacterium]